MAALQTLSAFTYGHTIDESNNKINFIEGASSEITATVATGSYSLDEFAGAISRALNTASVTLTFTVTLDRSTRLLTVSADGAFDLLISTGTNISTSTFNLMGFTGADLTGLLTYEADSVTGSIYYPQYNLQKYVAFEDIQEKNESAIKTSANGDVEVVFYGDVQFMKCEIKYVTDIVNQGVILNNATGVSDLRNFMTYLIGKKPIEFLPDKDTASTFTKCILESTTRSKDGTGFELKEMYSQGLAYYFETGILTFRKIN